MPAILRKFSLVLAPVILILTLIIELSCFVHAQSLQVQGLAVSPFLIETQVNAGKRSEQAITLTNTTDQPLPIDVSINDFIPHKATGQAIFLNPEEESNPAYALSSWITIVEQPKFIIAPHQQTKVVFSITPPPAATPGTHYGGLLFSYRHKENPKDTVDVTEKVGVIILAKLGQGNEQGSITDLSFAPHSKAYEFFTTFYNQGNVHLRPKGEIYLTNLFGQQVASIPVNRDAQVVMPDSQRVFVSEWQTGWRLGPYTATAVLYFGDPKLETRSSVTLWIVPWQRVLALVLVLLLIGVIFWKGLPLYNRRLIKRYAKNKDMLQFNKPKKHDKHK